MLAGFWQAMDQQLDAVELSQTVDDVLAALAGGCRCDDCSGDGFFAGSGGDRQLWDALQIAGWQRTWAEASYYYVAQSPTGDVLTYIEGDVYWGDRTGLAEGVQG